MRQWSVVFVFIQELGRDLAHCTSTLRARPGGFCLGKCRRVCGRIFGSRALSISWASSRPTLDWSWTVAAKSVWECCCRHVTIRSVWKECSITDIVAVTGPLISILIPWTVQEMTILCNTYNFECLLICALCVTSGKRISINSRAFCNIGIFRIVACRIAWACWRNNWSIESCVTFSFSKARGPQMRVQLSTSWSVKQALVKCGAFINYSVSA